MCYGCCQCAKHQITLNIDYISDGFDYIAMNDLNEKTKKNPRQINEEEWTNKCSDSHKQHIRSIYSHIPYQKFKCLLHNSS